MTQKICKWYHDKNISPFNHYWYEGCHETCSGNDDLCSLYNPISIEHKVDLLIKQYNKENVIKILDKVILSNNFLK